MPAAALSQTGKPPAGRSQPAPRSGDAPLGRHRKTYAAFSVRAKEFSGQT